MISNARKKSKIETRREIRKRQIWIRYVKQEFRGDIIE